MSNRLSKSLYKIRNTKKLTDHKMDKKIINLKNMVKKDIEKQEWDVYVNDNCIWCWICVAVCPNWFDLDDEWKAFVIEGYDEIDNIDDAIWSCPVGVIKYKK